MGPGSCYRRPAGPVNTACVIRIGDERRVWEEGVRGGVPFEVAGGEVLAPFSQSFHQAHSCSWTCGRAASAVGVVQSERPGLRRRYGRGRGVVSGGGGGGVSSSVAGWRRVIHNLGRRRS